MMDVIDKPPISDPPDLPPYLRKKGPERKRIIIVPCIGLAQNGNMIRDTDNNWKTRVYVWMMRIVGESLFDPHAKFSTTHTSTRRYRQWLETYTYEDGIPPHIQFGGCIKCEPEGDPTFYDRWKEYARETFY